LSCSLSGPIEQPPNTGKEPKDEKGDSTHGKPIGSSAANSDLAEKKSDATEQNSDDADSKHNPAEETVGWLRRKWEFVVVPKHANAIVAIFSVLLFVATSLYCVFAALQWNELKIQGRIARYALGEPRVVPNWWMGIYHSEQTQKMWAYIRVQNDGKTNAEFVSVAANFEFRPSDPQPTDYRFRPSDFKDTAPNMLVPFTSSDYFASVRYDLIQQISPAEYPAYKESKLYVWGIIRFQDFLGDRDEVPFCRYTTGDVFANKSGEGIPGAGYGGNVTSYNQCKTPNSYPR